MVYIYIYIHYIYIYIYICVYSVVHQASSWSDRAFYACSRAGIQAEDVAMAVLVQKLVAAEYSFVLHTVHLAVVGYV